MLKGIGRENKYYPNSTLMFSQPFLNHHYLPGKNHKALALLLF
jgi:hypothetical protein